MKIEELKYEFNQNILIRNIGKTTMAYNPETGDMYELNEVGEEIFNLLKQELEIDKLLEKLCTDYAAPKEEIYEDVEPFIIRMLELGTIKEVK